LSPSGSHRWLFCNGILAACKALPEQPDTIYSARGTLKHSISERCLKENLNPAQFLDSVHEVGGFTFDFDKVMCEEVASYVNSIRGELGKRFVEVRLDTSEVLGVPGQGGTGDAVILNRQDHSVNVHDAKFGYIEVSATEGVTFGKRADGTELTGNPQGLIYLASAMVQFDIYDVFDKGSFTIHQPSANHFDTAPYTKEEVEQFVEWARPRAQRAWKMYIGEIPIELTPGSWCKWCPMAERGCPARTQQMLDMFSSFDAKEEPQIIELSDEDVAAAYPIAEQAISWANDLIDEAQRRALRGSALPGYKLVRGKRGARFWKNKEAALTALSMIVEDETVLFTPGQLKSPTQIEEIVGANYASLSKHVDQPPGGLKLVPESAKGQAVSVTPAEFEPVNSQQETK
jgi:Protein of unknown function (DUF2800)